ncbi:MAG: LacI family transcriptional regulator [Promicromonosporaceae bacterium]|nr:LacI family transcriptional regulator [Promicromonosporaceae bacterium]
MASALDPNKNLEGPTLSLATGEPRLADIAEIAGVSMSTVSRVLNGKATVASSTRRAVLTALDSLGYDRYRMAGARATGLVGIILPELINPVFAAMAQVAGTFLTRGGYTPIVCTLTPTGPTEDEYIEALIKADVDGILFCYGMHADTTAAHDRYQRLGSLGLPIVLVGGHAPDVDVPQVAVDDATAMSLAVRHLASQGHRRIGLAVGSERFSPSQNKRIGFVEALVDAGLATSLDDAETHVVPSAFAIEGGQIAASELITAGHTAIVCGSDVLAIGAIRAARLRRLRVPEDVSVVGYDDSPLMSYTAPPLTTVRQPVRPLCQAAVQALLDEMRGLNPSRELLLIEPELVVRSTTAIAPSAD